MKADVCSNCHSQRRPIYRSGFCSKCYYWHRKRIQFQQEFNALSSHASRTRASQIQYNLRVCKRVLQEYEWRERVLNTDDVDPLDLESLVYAVAAECRSEVGFPLHSWFAAQTPQARKCFFSVFLAIVENIPSRLPRLNTLRPAKKGLFHDAWMDWSTDFYR
jgi:hypothetical protein